MVQIHTIMFWLALIFILTGTLLAIIGIWKPSIWEDTGWKLFMTDVVLGVGALLIAVITKWIG